MYLLVFFQCLKVFYRRYRDGRKVWYLLVTTFVMFSLITVVRPRVRLSPWLVQD